MESIPGEFCWAGNRGALTTTFTLPSTCLETTSLILYGIDIPQPSQATVYYVGLMPGSGGVSDSCMPPAATPISLEEAFYYSPGICPSSYSPAAQLLTLPNICHSAAALPETVSAWVCCPSGFFYPTATSFTESEWAESNLCISTASGLATLTSMWPVSWVSAEQDFQYFTFWPPVPPSGIVSAAVVTNPTVAAVGIPIFWESTDTEVQSWFDQFQGSGSLSTTSPSPTQSVATPTPTPTHSVATSTPTHSTTSPPPTQSVATPLPNNPKTSRASGRGRGNNLSVAALGAVSLIAFLILSS